MHLDLAITNYSDLSEHSLKFYRIVAIRQQFNEIFCFVFVILTRGDFIAINFDTHRKIINEWCSSKTKLSASALSAIKINRGSRNS